MYKKDTALQSINKEFVVGRAGFGPAIFAALHGDVRKGNVQTRLDDRPSLSRYCSNVLYN